MDKKNVVIEELKASCIEVHKLKNQNRDKKSVATWRDMLAKEIH